MVILEYHNIVKTTDALRHSERAVITRPGLNYGARVIQTNILHRSWVRLVNETIFESTPEKILRKVHTWDVQLNHYVWLVNDYIPCSTRSKGYDTAYHSHLSISYYEHLEQYVSTQCKLHPHSPQLNLVYKSTRTIAEDMKSY